MALMSLVAIYDDLWVVFDGWFWMCFKRVDGDEGYSRQILGWWLTGFRAMVARLIKNENWSDLGR